MLLSYKAGYCLPDRDPWLLLSPPLQPGGTLAEVSGTRTLPLALTGFVAKNCRTYFLGLKIRN